MDREWQARFHLSESDYNEWQNSAKTDSFAVYAVKSNKISMDQYMEWALNCYQIPFLTDSFFHNITINQELWNRVRDRAEWSETFLPLYEWDNILFAGCLARPEKTEDNSIVPVLVSPKNMSLFWNKIQAWSDHKTSRKHTKSPPPTRAKAPPQQSSKEEHSKADLLSKSTSLLNTFIKTTIGSSPQINIQEHESFAQVFKLAEKYFTGVIVFSFKNREFKPQEWSDSMEGPATPMKTDKPSVFRMIVHSRSPYHGFIIDNEQHKKFFRPWGFEKLPKHITLVPIFDSSKNITGAFMGIADKNLPAKCLYEITKWTTHLSTILKDTSGQKQKSA